MTERSYVFLAPLVSALLVSSAAPCLRNLYSTIYLLAPLKCNELDLESKVTSINNLP